MAAGVKSSVFRDFCRAMSIVLGLVNAALVVFVLLDLFGGHFGEAGALLIAWIIATTATTFFSKRAWPHLFEHKDATMQDSRSA